MNIIVCGAGNVGSSVVSYLMEMDYNVTLVDTNEALLSAVDQQYDLQTICGNAALPSILEQAGANNADAIIATTSHDEINIVICQLAKHVFNIPLKVARIRQEDYNSPKWQRIFEDSSFPIDVVLRPEYSVAKHLLKLVLYPGAFDYWRPTFQEDYISVGITITKDSLLSNTTISDFLLAHPHMDMTVLAYEHNGEALLYEEYKKLVFNDKVYFLVHRKHIKELLALCVRNRSAPTGSVVIGGAGKVGYFLAKGLEHKGITNIILLEKNPARAKAIAPFFNDSTVLVRDVLDYINTEAEVNENAQFVTVTNDDSTNLLSTLLLKKNGVKSAISLLNDNRYSQLFFGGGSNHILSPQHITTNLLSNFLTHAYAESSYSIFDNRIVCAAIKIQSKMAAANYIVADLLPLGKVNFPAYFDHEKKLHLTQDTTVLEPGYIFISVFERSKLNHIIKWFDQNTSDY